MVRLSLHKKWKTRKPRRCGPKMVRARAWRAKHRPRLSRALQRRLQKRKRRSSQQTWRRSPYLFEITHLTDAPDIPDISWGQRGWLFSSERLQAAANPLSALILACRTCGSNRQTRAWGAEPHQIPDSAPNPPDFSNRWFRSRGTRVASQTGGQMRLFLDAPPVNRLEYRSSQ